MAQQLIIRKLDYLPRFKRELKRLQPQLVAAAKDAIAALQKSPYPNCLRLHCVDKNTHPKIFTIDVTPNKAYKISFHMDGDIAVLRRVATHKEIDRLP